MPPTDVTLQGGDAEKFCRDCERMRSALRVIHTWASVPGALDPRHVLDLTERALDWERLGCEPISAARSGSQ